MATHRNRLVTTISNTPGTSGSLTVSAASSGYQTFAAGDDGLTFDISIVDGSAWEVRTGCTYTHSTTTLSRGTLEASSTGSAVNLTSGAIVTVTLTAGKGNAIEDQLSRGYVYVRSDGTTTQTLSSGAYSKIAAALATEVSDVNGWWDHTNKKFQPTRAGKYIVSTSCGLTLMNAGKFILLTLYKNGSEAFRLNRLDTGYADSALSATGTAIIDMNGSSDYVEVYMYNGDTVSRDVDHFPQIVWFTAAFLGA
jgi:hypothetical protein